MAMDLISYMCAFFLCSLLLPTCSLPLSIQAHKEHSVRFFRNKFSSQIKLENSNHFQRNEAQFRTSELSLSPIPVDFVDEKEEKVYFFEKTKNLILGKGWNGRIPVDKNSLSKLGLNMLLSYGFVSNVSYITCLIISWVAHGRTSGLSPLAPGQWKSFLVIYSGLFAANNILRPIRFSLSLV